MPKKRYYPLPDWDVQVYRNANNACVFCGAPMVTTIFSDVPVCDEHKDDGEDIEE